MPESEDSLTNLAEEMLEIILEIAPDRAEELKAIIRERGVHVTAVEVQHESPFLAIPATGEIRAHMPALKRQLVMALAYVMAYRSGEQDARVGVKRMYFTDSLRAIEAREMLRWAMLERYLVARGKENGETPPNESVPLHWFPITGAPPGSDDVIALQLFHTAMAADLYHELAHIAKSHEAGEAPEAVRQEEEADEEAARWLVGNRTENDPQFKGRMLGFALCQAYEVFLTLEGFKNDPVHPPLIGRLRRTIAGRVKDPDHAVWAFVAAVLSLHLELANRKFPCDRDREHPTFRDMAEYLMAVYERGIK